MGREYVVVERGEDNPHGGLFARDGVIEQVGPTAELPTTADTVLDLAGHIVLPGLINTHHHLYQGLTRVIPAGQDSELFDWLKALYPIWVGLTSEAIYVSTLTGLAEFILSGCTTASDHLYITLLGPFPWRLHLLCPAPALRRTLPSSDSSPETSISAQPQSTPRWPIIWDIIAAKGVPSKGVPGAS